MIPRSCLGPLLLASCFTLSLAACGDDKDATTAATTKSSNGDTSGSPDATSSTSSPGTTSTDTPAIEPTTGPDATTPDISTSDVSTSDVSTSDVSTSDTTSADDTTTDEPSTGPDGLSWAVDVWPVLNPPIACDCHNGGAGGLKMGNAGEAYANLVGVQSTGGPLDRVEPGKIEQSYLVHKLSGTQLDVNGSGATMPLGAPQLPQSTIDLLEQWIFEGAAP